MTGTPEYIPYHPQSGLLPGYPRVHTTLPSTTRFDTRVPQRTYTLLTHQVRYPGTPEYMPYQTPILIPGYPRVHTPYRTARCNTRGFPRVHNTLRTNQVRYPGTPGYMPYQTPSLIPGYPRVHIPYRTVRCNTRGYPEYIPYQNSPIVGLKGWTPGYPTYPTKDHLRKDSQPNDSTTTPISGRGGQDETARWAKSVKLTHR